MKNKNTKKLLAIILCICTVIMLGIFDTVYAKYASTVELPELTLTVDGTNIPSSIEVTKAPDKTIYNHADDFDPTGMVVTVRYTDGTSAQVTDYTLSNDKDLNSNGQTSITVSYEENGITKSIEYPITINKVLDRIAVTTPPTKTEYIEGEDFDASGMVVTAYYTDGTSAQVTNYSLSGHEDLQVDTTAVTVSLTHNQTTKTTTQAVSVKPALALTLSVPDQTLSKTYTVSGTSTGAKAVTVNGKAATVNSDGTWTAEITLDGLEVTAVASDEKGNTVSQTITYTEFSITRSNRGEIGYTSASTTLTIPATFKDSTGNYRKVTSIADAPSETGAFYNCTNLTGDLVIPDSIISIGSYAFDNCHGFNGNLTIPNSVQTIGDSAFENCYGFTGNLTIPNGVPTIGNSAFYGCSGFTGSLTIPDSVTSIGNKAFQNCSGFTGNLTIGNSVQTIGDSAFHSCYYFTGSLTIPNSVQTIGDNAFDNCRGFTGNLTIPNSVTSIGEYAFYCCSGFTGNLTIGNSVISIGNYAFAGCYYFTGSLTIPDSVISIGNYAFQDCDFSGNLTIGNSVISIGNYAFDGCSGFTGSMTIPNSVQTIGIYAFRACYNLSEAIFENKTGWYLFSSASATSGTSVDVTDSTTAMSYLKTFRTNSYWKRDTSATSLSLTPTIELPEGVITGQVLTISVMPDISEIITEVTAHAPENTVLSGWLVDSGMAQQFVSLEEFESVLTGIYSEEPEWTLKITSLYKAVKEPYVEETEPNEEPSEPAEETTQVPTDATEASQYTEVLPPSDETEPTAPTEDPAGTTVPTQETEATQPSKPAEETVSSEPTIPTEGTQTPNSDVSTTQPSVTEPTVPTQENTASEPTTVPTEETAATTPTETTPVESSEPTDSVAETEPTKATEPSAPAVSDCPTETTEATESVATTAATEPVASISTESTQTPATAQASEPLVATEPPAPVTGEKKRSKEIIPPETEPSTDSDSETSTD